LREHRQPQQLTYFSLLLTFFLDKSEKDIMETKKQVKKLVVGVIGGITVLAGLAMIVLPGPAFVFIPAGLAILATEFSWAKKSLQKAKEKLRRTTKSEEKNPMSDHS
jgi:uncharacterized protein (TIGR02611 family)